VKNSSRNVQARVAEECYSQWNDCGHCWQWGGHVPPRQNGIFYLEITFKFQHIFIIDNFDIDTGTH
jgi:hypothetical protein